MNSGIADAHFRGDTLPRLLQRNGQNFAAQTAVREKRHGIWQAATWAEHAAATLTFARGLAALGFAKGDRLAILGDNRPALYRAQLAATCLGGVCVPCWPDADTDWLAHVLADAGVSIVVAEDQDQLEKLLAIKHQVPNLREIVFTDPRGVHHENLSFIRSVAAVVQAGEKGTADMATMIAAGMPDDVALICYVTPAAGLPRAVELTHANLIAAATALTKAEDVRQTDECFSFLPMAWIGDALYSTALALVVGFATSCPEDPETARRDLRELGPTILLAPPRIWESLLSEIEIKAAHATPLKKRVCDRYLPQPYGDVLPMAGAGGVLGEWLVNAPVRDQLGLGRVRWAHTGGLTLAPHIAAFFMAIGVRLRHGFGPAACAGLATLQTDGPVTLGRACEGVALRVSAAGEIEVSGANVAQAGWWGSGQAGQIAADGTLTLAGSLADRGTLADGTAFVPHDVETALGRSRFLADVVAIGDRRPFVGALVAIDAGAVGDWAQLRNLSFAGTADLVALAEVKALIRDEIARGNARLPAALRVRRYILMDTVPAAFGSEASLSRVLQRRLALDVHADTIEALFATAAIAPAETVDATGSTVREQAA